MVIHLPAGVRFQRFNPDDEGEVAELARQRIVRSRIRLQISLPEPRTDFSLDSSAAGTSRRWSSGVSFVESERGCGFLSSSSLCRADVFPGEQELFWVFYAAGVEFELPELEVLNLDSSKFGPPPSNPSFKPIGHVALVRTPSFSFRARTVDSDSGSRLTLLSFSLFLLSPLFSCVLLPRRTGKTTTVTPRKRVEKKVSSVSERSTFSRRNKDEDWESSSTFSVSFPIPRADPVSTLPAPS
jgi:hypothetical protein